MDLRKNQIEEDCVYLSTTQNSNLRTIERGNYENNRLSLPTFFSRYILIRCNLPPTFLVQFIIVFTSLEIGLFPSFNSTKIKLLPV